MLTERTVGGLHAHLLTIVEQMNIHPEISALDIGCGSGAWLSRLQEKGLERLVGVDYVLPPHVAGLDMRQFDINEDDFTSLGNFKIVTCIEVIEHVENIGRLLNLIKMVLEPDGVAIVTTPNIESLRARTRALVSGKFLPLTKRVITHI